MAKKIIGDYTCLEGHISVKQSVKKGKYDVIIEDVKDMSVRERVGISPQDVKELKDSIKC